MTISRYLEKAMARYLSNESVAVTGGLYTLKTQSGSGASIAIRKGTDDSGVLPDSGWILCDVEGESIQQTHIGLNYFTTRITFTLAYPADDYASDTDVFDTARHVEREMEKLLFVTDFCDRLTATGEGVVVHGLTAGWQFRSEINGRQRLSRWEVDVAVSVIENVV